MSPVSEGPFAEGPLRHIRVVDITEHGGEIAGRMLADLGADVIKVETADGASGRRRGPHHEDAGSLFWAAYGRGKRSVQLDRSSSEGQRRFDELVGGADIVFASEPSNGMTDRHPRLIWVCMTPFGSSGPHADLPATDLTLEAAGGLLALQGDPDRPPVPVGFPQAFLHAGAQAAADSLMALHERQRSGLGQELDVSAQAAVVWTLMSAFGWAMLLGSNVPGTCERRDEMLELVPGVEPPMPRYPVWQTADGYSVVTLQLPRIGERTIAALVDWASAEAAISPDLAAISWLDWRTDLRAGDLQRSDADRVIVELQAFVKTKTNAELHRFAAGEGITIAAIHSLNDVLGDDHLEARSFWASVGDLRHPYEWAKFSRTPILHPQAAPAMSIKSGAGEQSPQETWRSEPARPQPARPAADTTSERSQTLADLKVADFAWVGAGPLITRAFADHGADVIRMESAGRPDILRQLPPMADGVAGINRSQFFGMMNTSKRAMALDLSSSEGREIARELIDWADVVVESFTPGAMERLGFGYESLAADRPELIMLSTCLRGQSGPEQSLAGFGNQGAALSGLYSVTGWPGRAPCGPWGAYTDFITPRFGVTALLAALHHRNETGEGQHIDLSQVEVGIQFIEPKLLEAQLREVSGDAVGHDADDACPHGVFESADGRHVAIAVETAAQWRSFVDATGFEHADPSTLDSLDRRIDEKAAIETQLSTWCSTLEHAAITAALQGAGVPAHLVTYPSELIGDPQLDHREFFSIVDHPEIGPVPMEGHVTRFSATPPSIRRPSPMLGQHTDEILAETLGYSPEKIAALRSAGTLD